MDRLNQLRGEAGGSRDSTLDTSSPPSEAFMTANESSSKYFSLSEVDSTFDISPIKDITLASASVDSEKTITEPDQLISNLSPIGKKSDFDTYKIGKQIEAANILSGGVDIFDDNDNSYDGDELVIDDNAEIEEKSNPELKLADPQFKDENSTEAGLVEAEAVPSKDTEVILQIDGKNVDAIDIGNGLYLYRKEGQEELAAVQIIDDDQHQPSFKFLKVRENAERNLEVYEEIQIEVPKEVPVKEEKVDKNVSHVPIKGINKVMSDSTSNKIAERKMKTQTAVKPSAPAVKKPDTESKKEGPSECKPDSTVNKKIKFSESRKSPVIGSFTPMTFHSTPNKEGIPLTKTMVDLQLHPSRHSDNVKKTIEVHTDNVKQRSVDQTGKEKKDLLDDKDKQDNVEKEVTGDKSQASSLKLDNKDLNKDVLITGTKEVVNPEIKEIVNIETRKVDNVEINEVDDTGIKEIVNTESKEVGNTESKEVGNTESKEVGNTESKEVGNTESKEAGNTESKEVGNTESKEVGNTESKEVNNTESKEVGNTESKKVNTDINEMVNTEIQEVVNTEIKDAGSTGTMEVAYTDLKKDDEIMEVENLIIDETIENLDKEDQEESARLKDRLPEKDTLEAVQLLDSSKNVEEKGSKDCLENKDLKKVEQDEPAILEQNKKNNSSPASYTKQGLTDENKSIKESCAKESSVNEKSITDHGKEIETKKIIESEQNIDNKIIDASNVQEKYKLDPVVASVTEIAKIDSINANSLKDIPVVNSSVDITNTTLNEPKCKIDDNKSVDSKIMKKETTFDITLKSSETPKKQELINSLSDKGNNLATKSTEPASNAAECCTKGNVLVVQESVKAPEVNKADKVSVTVKTDPKDMPAQITTKAEPGKMIDEIRDEKSKTIPKPDIKKVVAQTSNKVVVDVKAIPSPNLASNSTESLKTASKLQTSPVKDKEKEVKKPDFKPTTKQLDIKQNVIQTKTDSVEKKAVPKTVTSLDQKPINNNHAPVPFGKWTDVNRQAFLNKIKESKVPTNSSNGKQIKNSNDLNRRDVLKKIDSQRQAQELANMTKLGVKKETAFASKTSVPQEPKTSVKTEIPILKNNSAAAKKITKQEAVAKPQTVTTNTMTSAVKKESIQRKEINNQDLIDKTIEGIINRAVKSPHEELSQTVTKESSSVQKSNDLPPQPQIEKPNTQKFDDIEMKMNELHGIPFIERPAHELPHPTSCLQKAATKSLPKAEAQKPPVSKPSKIPNLLPFVSKVQKSVKDNNIIDVDSEEEVIEHEPITGDMDLTKKDTVQFPMSENPSLPETLTLISADSSKKETIITEKDFDKFVRRNSINYENCLTVNFDSKEPHHNVVQTIVQKDTSIIAYSKPETPQSDVKLLSPRKHEQITQNSLAKPVQNISKFGNIIGEDDCNKNYQSKVKMAYQTAMTAKRQLERPISIIEDRPVKVVYMDSNTEYHSTQLNVQGQELSPAKKPSPTQEIITTQITDSLDSDTLDSIEECKVIDDTKVKTKHQRKQVLTPVETPELELIAPSDLGIEVSPKKKRRTEEKSERSTKTLMPKKTYLLGRGNTTEDSNTKPFDLSKSSQREPPKQEPPAVSHKNTASAIDSLVKAAELLETQSATMPTKSPDMPTTPDSQLNTPIKRGRGRPRKYPLPEGASDKAKVPSPQKKPRLIDAKVVKNKDTDDDDNDEDSTDDEMVKENWTMGKINENIVCPICNKLFRSENVVFKHVKHCTGPSPSRSDSDSKSPRRLRYSQESETKSFGSKSDSMEIDEIETAPKDVGKKRKSKDTSPKTIGDKDDVIVIEDTPIKPRPDKRDESKASDTRKTINKNKVPDKVTSLVCEFCGKTFRQLSYLVSHKLQHAKDGTKKNDEDSTKNIKSVFSCEVCKKEFRKLHHLVQHRIIHNPSNVTAKLSRKSSSEQSDQKTSKDQSPSKQNDDTSAGFRCEPCDKSFRKLHHLVEHRETHDGINRQKVTTTAQTNAEKLPPPPQCDICKKTFRKLHHLIEHKEQHLETSSEKSDDKSIKSSLSTKDIIHECSLCYMVFPNEHSLNKHTIICQRKKRQSATKQLKLSEDGDKTEEEKETTTKPEENKLEADDDVTIVMEEIPKHDKPVQEEKVSKSMIPVVKEDKPIVENTIKPTESNQLQPKESAKPVVVAEKSENNKIVEVSKEPTPKPVEVVPDLPVKIKKSEDKEPKPKVQETPRKKTLLKDKVAPTVTKRHKPNLPPPPVIDDSKPSESSDDDEIRYMLNPDYKFEDNEGKLFMKVRANKRNSLQIERPNSKDLVKRRISLQHPPKVPRLKPKAIPSKAVVSSAAINTKTVVKAPKLEPVPSIDSDDSDVKYSFPEPPSDNAPNKDLPVTTPKESAKKTQRKSLAEKRKSLSSIAKRKSLGKAVGVKHKIQPQCKAPPLKQVRKRTAEAEHRCDCGQLFSSAALLARHATLAHTPPRIRRRRSPPPAAAAPAPRRAKPTPAASRKSSVRSDVSTTTTKPAQPSTKRKSSIKTEPKTPNEPRKTPKSSDKESVKSATSNVKLRRYAAHKGVPVPEKMRKLMEKSKK